VRIAVCLAAGLFNLGQGVLRPTLPLYLQVVFGASYRMVTLIPTVFGAGKWVASLPTGYLVDRWGRRRLMTSGLLLIAVCDLASAMTTAYGVFLGLRALGGVGWAMFGTVATVTMVDRPAARQRGQTVSLAEPPPGASDLTIEVRATSLSAAPRAGAPRGVGRRRARLGPRCGPRCG
jgi:MFS family permease